ncbi:Hypothetical protein AA314_05304 [Archangium gephyra]|uniref:Uncharacterized protein n=1 Tax=Archangium gephyra TaxID=48 RepID=A0AAC8Q9V1_9BACT|nr:Hypothetical protein AA314_05304 [Archangium gephyra]
MHRALRWRWATGLPGWCRTMSLRRCLHRPFRRRIGLHCPAHFLRGILYNLFSG